MNNEQTEMLIRVDQNVINLVKTFEKHIEDDKTFQTYIYKELEPLKAERNERRGAARFAASAYGALGAIIALVGQFVFNKGS